jgi:hypothetical protein
MTMGTATGMPAVIVQFFIDTRPLLPPIFVLRDTQFLDSVACRDRKSVQHGESLIEFSGRDRVQAQRKAVSWWFAHRQSLGLCLKEFFLRCRFSDDQRTITFMHP